MSGYRFNYGPGRMNVRFVQSGAGRMRMHLRLRSGVEPVTEVDDGFAPTGSSSGGGEILRRRFRISAPFCPFPQMIAWLEAISLGLNHCSWRWDGEGPEYELAWNVCQLVIREEYSAEQPEEMRVTLDRRQMIAAFYLSFRRFVSSRRYQPAEYERRRVGEIMVEAEGHGLTEEELRGRLLMLDAAELEPTLQMRHLQGALARKEYADEFPGAYRDTKTRVGSMLLWRFPYVKSEWDDWDTPRRRARIRKIFDLVDDGYFGTPLRALRSEVVERLLRTEEKPER